jgi:SWI/SNF-related matrix-associated actin-dependent regulator of chromatin subfamily A member 5
MMRGYNYCRLDGSTDLEDRESQIKSFTAKGSKDLVFLVSTRAGGLGINLTSANHVVLYDSDFNPMVDLQAMDRAHRIGQTKTVFVYRLVTKDSVEEKLIERQAIKLKLDELVIQQGRQVNQNKKLSKDEYEKVLLHGATNIMQQKSDRIGLDGQNEEIDIDKLIEEGLDKAKKTKEEADN